MHPLRRNPFRVTFRLVWFSGVVAAALSDYFFRCAFRANGSKRARWLQRHSRRALRIFRFEAQVSGVVPQSGLLISNHLSYLDILVLSSLAPAVFVSKREVRDWPIVGWLAGLAGTLFVDRARRLQVGQTNEAIQKVLDGGALVVLFPEGTSSDGKTVLPFKSSLLEPAANLSFPIHVCSIHYTLDDGDAGNEVCYWGDHVFFPHLLNLLGKRRVRAMVRFGDFSKATNDRKKLARDLREEILTLKNGAPS